MAPAAALNASGWRLEASAAGRAEEDLALLERVSAELLRGKAAASAEELTPEKARALLCERFLFLSVCGGHERGPLVLEDVWALVSVAVPVLFGALFVLGAAGNALVMAVVLHGRRSSRGTTGTLVLNLAVSDLLFIVFCVPPTGLTYLTGDDWRFGDIWCKVVQYCIHVAAYTSIYTLVLMSLDRFLAVVHPVGAISLRTPRNAGTASLLTWVVFAMLCTPAFLVYGVAPTADPVAGTLKRACQFLSEEHSYPAFQTAFFVTSYFLPLAVTVCLYLKIIRRLWSLSGRHPGRQARDGARKRRRVSTMVVIVMAIFAACWLPIQLLLLLKSFGVFRSDSYFRVILQISAQSLAYSNSCVNPILYAFLSENFKDAFKDAVSCRWVHAHHPGTANSNPALEAAASQHDGRDWEQPTENLQRERTK